MAEDCKTARRMLADDIGRWRWLMRECENHNLVGARLMDTKNTLHELINERYGLVEGDQFQPDGTIVRALKPPPAPEQVLEPKKE